MSTRIKSVSCCLGVGTSDPWTHCVVGDWGAESHSAVELHDWNYKWLQQKNSFQSCTCTVVCVCVSCCPSQIELLQCVSLWRINTDRPCVTVVMTSVVSLWLKTRTSSFKLFFIHRTQRSFSSNHVLTCFSPQTQCLFCLLCCIHLSVLNCSSVYEAAVHNI